MKIKKPTQETYDPRIHGVTQGLLATFQRCRQEAKNYISRIESIHTGAGLQFGSLAHTILELGYKQKTVPDEKVVYQLIDRARAEYLEERGGRLSGQESELMEMSMLLLEVVMPAYFRHYAKDFTTMKWAELEQKFRVASPVSGVDLVGRIDGAFWIGKELWQFESKTKSRIEEDDLSQKLTFDFQNNSYQYLLERKYKSRPQGVLYNIIRRPGQRKKVGEGMTAFQKRVAYEIAKDPAHFFVRFEVAMPASEQKRFSNELGIIVQEFYDWWRTEFRKNEMVARPLDTFRNTSACIQAYGACKYLPLCANNERGMYRERKGEIFAELKRP